MAAVTLDRRARFLASRGQEQGIALPRVEDANAQAAFLAIIQRLQTLEGESRSIVNELNRGGTGTIATPTDPNAIPFLDTPPTPEGVQALGGIDLVFVSWANPFRFYQNHAHANVYRNSVDRFDTAVVVGTAGYTMYIDDDVEDSTTYWYWVSFTSTASVEGLQSLSAEATTALDVEEIYEEIEDWVSQSPLATYLGDLETAPSLALNILEEARRLAGGLGLLTIDGTINEAAAIRVEIAAIQATLGTFNPGMAPNEFSADTMALAEAARDTQSTGDSAWLATYTATPTNYIVLEYL